MKTRIYIPLALGFALLGVGCSNSSATAPGTSSVAASSGVVVSSSSSVAQTSSNTIASSSSVAQTSSSTIASSSSVAQTSSSTIASSSSAAQTSSSTVSSQNTQTCIYTAAPTNTLVCAEQTYKTVTIGTQVWMAQNLNYTPSSGNLWCYGNNASNCTTYGRLYDYPAALTACPTGWHLPDTTAWNTLEAYVGGAATAGSVLKAVSSLWTTYSGITNLDAYGFSALPGGYYHGSFSYVGNSGYWWTATANGSFFAYDRDMDSNHAYVYSYDDYQSDGLSVRCLQNP